MRHPVRSHRLLDQGRLLSIVDGIFAVAMTLLVLDLKLPSDQGDLVQGLRQMLPGFLVYLVAFASIAGFQHIAHVDGETAIGAHRRRRFVDSPDEMQGRKAEWLKRS